MKYFVAIILIGLLASCGDDQSSTATNNAQVKTESKRNEMGDNTESRLEQSKESIGEASQRPNFTFFKDNEIEILSKVLSDSLIYQLDSLEEVLLSYSGEEDLISIYYDARELEKVLNIHINTKLETWDLSETENFLMDEVDKIKEGCFEFDYSAEYKVPPIRVKEKHFFELAQKEQKTRDSEFFSLIRNMNRLRDGLWDWRSYCCDFEFDINLGDRSMIDFITLSSSYIDKYQIQNESYEYKTLSKLFEALRDCLFYGRYYYQKEKILSELDLLISFESDFLSASKEKMKLLRERIINDQLDCDDCDDGIGTIQLNCEKEICPCC